MRNPYFSAIVHMTALTSVDLPSPARPVHTLRCPGQIGISASIGANTSGRHTRSGGSSGNSSGRKTPATFTHRASEMTF